MKNVNVLVETEGLSTEEWLRYRQRGIGGSDVAAILGISKWSSAIDIWLSKTNQVFNNTEENEAMTWGKILEPVIRDRFREVTGKKTVEVHAMLQSEAHPYMIADIDGLTEDDNGEPAILEIKCVSEYKASEWDNDSIPEYYQVQAMHYMAVTGIDMTYFACLVGGNKFIIRELHADPDMQNMLIAVEGDFWKKCVNMERPQADGSDACTNLLNSIYKGGINEEIYLPDDVIDCVQQYIDASVAEDNAKALKQEAGNRIKEVMGDYNTAKYDRYTFTWKPVSTDRLDTKALKENEPEVYKKYVKTTTSRRFQMK